MPFNRHVVNNMLAPLEVFQATYEENSIKLLIAREAMDQLGIGRIARFRGKILMQCECI